ncbi:uncharacterized protein LOC126841500 isoform X20 [Adelges cooleyi]|uniref:uncharacterized protein LOC126841500 isoform X18 n=1 Tax=Adelges cooleyi TaxID=133065 RepID=UPI0021806445|nr:uncharacterized protein LOC126841500 isoform X18 [Adelges cooleyi]XP_050433994.1 uncharacterized protein LOC126841500 isoform X19 [Adelges cooleyi]XP_050433995.1 uncharacterized protein LOC126841500 isoform X20 [Adelges cooleyi]
MKLFCLLFSLFLVESLAYYYDRYVKLVHLTNMGIRRAYLKNDLRVRGRSGASKICLLLAVPDHDEILFMPEHPDLYDKANLYFNKMLQDLNTIAGVDMEGCSYPYEYSLKQLANDTRKLVAWSLKSIIGRRMLGESVRVDDTESLIAKCLLLGIYFSTQSPESYIKQVDIDSRSRTCITTDTRNIQKRYRKIEGTWFEIHSGEQRGESLEAQLQYGYPRVQPTY